MNETWLLYACGILLTRLAYLPNDERLVGHADNTVTFSP